MGIMKEHLKILECYEYADYTVKDLKQILDISESRIRLYTIELCEYYGIETLSELKLKVRLNTNWRKEIKNDSQIDSKSRRNFILINFLQNDIVNLSEMSSALDVTRRTITADLNGVKKFLHMFNLDYISLNSRGIKLIGSENDKKRLFNELLFNIFMKRKYLPNIYDDIFKDFNSYVDKSVQTEVRELLKRKNVIEHTYLILQIEILIYMGICRNDGIFNVYKSMFEVRFILKICKKNNVYNLLENYSKEFYKVKDFMKYINKKLKCDVDISEKSYVSLVIRFKLIEYKNKFSIKENYLLNRNFKEKYGEVFNHTLLETIEKYFPYKIDSLDKISIFLILKKYLYKNKIKEDKSEYTNIIVYDIFQKLILEEVCEELEGEGIKIDDIVSEYMLEAYLSKNSVKNILLFESIELSEFIKTKYEIKVFRASFPLEEIDYLKIKKILE